MADTIRAIVSRIRRWQRLMVRAELTLGALQTAFWLVTVGVSVGAVLMLRHRIVGSRRDEVVDEIDNLHRGLDVGEMPNTG